MLGEDGGEKQFRDVECEFQIEKVKRDEGVRKAEEGVATVKV